MGCLFQAMEEALLTSSKLPEADSAMLLTKYSSISNHGLDSSFLYQDLSSIYTWLRFSVSHPSQPRRGIHSMSFSPPWPLLTAAFRPNCICHPSHRSELLGVEVENVETEAVKFVSLNLIRDMCALRIIPNIPDTLAIILPASVVGALETSASLANTSPTHMFVLCPRCTHNPALRLRPCRLNPVLSWSVLKH